MGSSCCKPKKNEILVPLDQLGDRATSKRSSQEDEELDRIRQSLKYDLETFLLNNILMSVQFFENYETNIQNIRDDHSVETILRGHKFKSFQADSVHKLVGSRVTYQERHGPNKGQEQYLHPLRNYLTYLNVEAAFSHEEISSDKPKERPYYRFVIEECEKENKAEAGFVNLRELQTFEEEVIYEEIREGTAPETSALLETAQQNQLNKYRQNSVRMYEKQLNQAMRDFNSAGSSMADASRRFQTTKTGTIKKSFQLEVVVPPNSNYGYTTLKELTKFYLLDDVRNGSTPANSSAIPRTCFQEVQVSLLQDKRRIGTFSAKKELFKNYFFLNSVEFKAHFGDVFVERLAEALDISIPVMNDAYLQGSHFKYRKNKVQHCVIPSIGMKSWPRCGNEFLKPGTPDQLEWPTAEMVSFIEGMGCHMIPLGFLPTKEKNESHAREWRIECPKGEDFLLSYMPLHSHIRCYLFLLAIYKTFLEEERESLSFGPQHLLHLLFWEIRKDFQVWPEDRPGETLLKYLTVLYSAIQKRRIRDFFIKERNLLESSPSAVIHRIQGKLKDILQNPVPHVMLAIKNLQLRRGFYPTLDYSKLFKLVTEKDIVVYFNPSLAQGKKRNETSTSDVESVDDEERKFRLQLRRNTEATKASKKEVEINRKSVETINCEGEIVIDEDERRRQELLMIFIPHFIEMAEKSRAFKANEQAMEYANHCERLNKLLEENQGTRDDVRRFTEIINGIKRKCKNRLMLPDLHMNEDENIKEIPIYKQKLPELPVIRVEMETQPGNEEPVQETEATAIVGIETAMIETSATALVVGDLEVEGQENINKNPEGKDLKDISAENQDRAFDIRL